MEWKYGVGPGGGDGYSSATSGSISIERFVGTIGRSLVKALFVGLCCVVCKQVSSKQ